MIDKITVEEYNAMKEEDRDNIILLESLDRLLNNPDFKLVFLEHYMRNEAIRNVHLLGDPTLFLNNKDRENIREDVKEAMIGISRFSAYLRKIRNTGRMAMERLEQLEAARQASAIDDTILTNS